MLGETAKILYDTFIKDRAKHVPAYFREYFKKNYESSQNAWEKTQKIHFSEVVNWSSTLDFIGLDQPKIVHSETIPLTISNQIRILGNGFARSIQEEKILEDKQNYILLGDPGGGKTTTLKRITNQFFFGDTPSPQKLPILIRLKELNGISLYEKICETIGLTVSKHKEVVNKREVTRIYIGNEILDNNSQLIENALPHFLDNMKCLLILDGYDEIENEYRYDIRQEITRLSRKSMNYKILMSSRHGEDFDGLEGFTFCEIKPLDKDQIKLITQKWSSDPAKFLKALYKRPYNEIGNRPLFLNFLILHFNKLSYLPAHSHDATRKIIRLLLEDWNKYQNVKRSSRYSDFFTDEKIDFLSRVAYKISFEVRAKQFKHSHLLKIYKEICERFKLNINEANDVVAEIESHTGIIQRIYDDNYEFSHLVIQEYLAAEYIVSQPFSDKTLELFWTSPATMAVATCLSTESGKYFTDLFLNTQFSATYSDEQTAVYLKRVILEDAYLEISTGLGLAFLYLFYKYHANPGIISSLLKLSSNQRVVASIEKALKMYSLSQIPIDEYRVFEKSTRIKTFEKIKIPILGALPKSVDIKF